MTVEPVYKRSDNVRIGRSEIGFDKTHTMFMRNLTLNHDFFVKQAHYFFICLVLIVESLECYNFTRFAMTRFIDLTEATAPDEFYDVVISNDLCFCQRVSLPIYQS